MCACVYICVCIWGNNSIWLDWVIAWDTWGEGARSWVSLPPSAASVSGRCRWVQSSRRLWPEHISSSHCFSSVLGFYCFEKTCGCVSLFLTWFHWWLPQCCYSSSLTWNFQSLRLFSGKILEHVEVIFGASLACFFYFNFSVKLYFGS